MPDVTLLSNGSYHVLVTAEGTGYDRWNDMAVTRWREDAALDDFGTFFFIRDVDDSRVWSAPARPRSTPDDHEIDAVTTIAVAGDRDVALRRLRLTNRSSRRRTLSVTSYSEIVLSSAAADSAHPAFSKLFVETEIDAALGAIFASRRAS
ncbi:MAG: glycosyl transferase family 36, partial [Pseudomonadota bacterium]|nr:glycosyl transferase family 36 [Pseudomonadota bacterium]